ncbi:MAG: dihydroorotase [Candidatus Hatepunaea meridiana]|nr:dihydroorotase [Candidatus Hatepunaea meridiana]
MQLNNNIILPKGWRAFTTEKLAIRGARMIDPSIGLDLQADLIIQDGTIKHIGEIPDGWDGENVDAKGLIACPGLFDMHVHLREPGYEHKETIQTGCIAAAVGGFTGVAPMPNTNPALDNPGLINFVRERALGFPVDVHPIAAVTVGRRGQSLTEIGELFDDGVTTFSDDGSPVASAELMRRALEYTRMFDVVISEHCEEPSLTAKGVMHEGAVSTRLGLPGWPSIGEEIAIERNIRLAEFTGGRIHIAHISTAGSVEIVRQAKARGVNVTAEVTPHHLTLDCTILEGFNSDYKVNPPLRTLDDIEALIEGLTDGTIDAIATDHAPHAPDEKEVEFINTPFGMIGLETALGVIHTRLVLAGKLSLQRMIEVMTSAPRRIMHLPAAEIKVNSPVNITLFNPDEKWMVDRELMYSKGKNTPYHGWELTGRPCGIINRGVAWIRKG